MTVQELIKQLGDYSLDEEIYVEYWDKATVESFMWDGMSDMPRLTDDQWSQVVEEMENHENYHTIKASEALVETADSIMAGGRS